VFDHDAPTRPPTLTDRLQGLKDNLHTLARRLRDAIAGAVSQAVAHAVRDLVRRLLGDRGRQTTEHDPHSNGSHWQRNDLTDDAFESSGRDQDEPEHFWESAYEERGRLLQVARPCPTDRHWGDAFRDAVQAAWWWLRQQPTRRPVLTTALIVLAAGGTVLVAGPTCAGCVSVVASVASLILTAESARTVVDLVNVAAG